jgi:predicted phosphoribosyltransferase
VVKEVWLMSDSNRIDVGRHLAGRIVTRHLSDPVVIALSSGGVKVAWEIARRLSAPLDVLLAREVIVPGWQQLSVGAIAGDQFFPDGAAIAAHGMTLEYANRLAGHETDRMMMVERELRGRHLPLDVEGKDVVLVDNGWGSPLAIEAAVTAIHGKGARTIIFASPLAERSTMIRLIPLASVETCYPENTCRSVLLGDRGLVPATRSEAADLIARSREEEIATSRPFAGSAGGAPAFSR